MSGKGNKYAQTPDDSLDLHGYQALEAVQELEDYIVHSRDQNFKIIRVITGKGLHNPDGVPVLRNAVESFLRQNSLDYRYGKWGEGENGVIDITL
jgi:DNA-nicking Smr family endonuclease